jgi:type I restriction enzyme S subunit
MTANGWPMVHFGDVLQSVSRPVTVEPDVMYRILGMRWYAQGLFLKEEKPGSDIRANELYRVELGDFVYNRLFAWKGSFGIVGTDTAGGCVSGEFPCFQVDTERANAKFLHLYLSQERIWQEIERISSGQTNISRLRLKEPIFLAMEIPLPPLEEQRHIVARIEELAAKIEEARGLRRKAVQQCDNLLRSIIFNDRADYRLTAMHELVKLREPDVQVQPDEVYQFAGVYCFGEGVFKGPCKSGLEFAYSRLTRLHAGNFVYPKLMAWEGALGIVPDDCDGFVVSTEFPVFEIDQSHVLPEILDVYFRSPQVWPLLSAISTGTNVRRRRLNPRDFLEFQMLLPPMPEQLKFREVKKRVDAVKRLQAGTSAELDALLPSVLDRAFKGEL